MELLTPVADDLYPAQSVAYTGTAGVTTAVPSGPQGVVVWCTTAAHVLVGEGVTATTASLPLPANVPVPLTVPFGTGAPWRVSAVQTSGGSGGTLYMKAINIR